MIEWLTQNQDILTTEAVRVIARDMGIDPDWIFEQIV